MSEAESKDIEMIDAADGQNVNETTAETLRDPEKIIIVSKPPEPFTEQHRSRA
jgi:hypothetical protein